jgi:hypothetical protein
MSICSWRLLSFSIAGCGLLACSGATGKLPLDNESTSSLGSTDHDAAGGSSSSGSSSVVIADATAGDAAAGDATMSAEAAAEASDPCAGLALCEDFESTSPGQPPRTSLWSIGAPGCGPNGGTVTIDSSRAHSGRHSAKVVDEPGSNGTAPAYCDHVFFNNTAVFANLGPQIYARFFVYLGMPIDPTSHVTFATMTDKNDNNHQLRVGIGSDVFVWNRESDDAFLPELDTGNSMINPQAPGAVQPTTGQWFCVEFHIDQNAGNIDTWIDGAEVSSMAETGTPVPDVSTVWLSGSYATWRPQISSFGLGWETYFDKASDAMTLWFDDVAIASHPIGCESADP